VGTKILLLWIYFDFRNNFNKNAKDSGTQNINFCANNISYILFFRAKLKIYFKRRSKLILCCNKYRDSSDMFSTTLLFFWHLGLKSIFFLQKYGLVKIRNKVQRIGLNLVYL